MAQANAMQSEVDSFNQLVGAARTMVMRLATQAAVSASMTVTEIAEFQASFNKNRGIVYDEILAITEGGWRPAQLALELRNKGLTVDGKYGQRTGTALLLVMWARAGTVEAAATLGGIIPSNPAQFPQYYVANRTAYDANLAPYSSGEVTTPPPIPTVPTNPIPTQPSLPPAVVTPGGDDLDFGDDGSTVVGTGKGKMSFAAVLAILMGVGVVGGFTWYGLKKSGKLPRALRRR